MMHIILSEFINTSDNLSDIVEKHYDKNEYLETVFLKIVRTLNLEDIDENLFKELDRAIIKGHPDPNIYLLFISVALRFTSSRFQLERARVIYSIGASLSSNELPPILNAYFTIQFATLCHYEGKSIERDQLLKESIALVDKKSPRYRSFIYLKASIISEEGRLNELDQSDLTLIEMPINEKQAIHCDELKIKNLIFNGDSLLGFKQLEGYRKKIKDDYQPVQIFNNLFKLLANDFDEKNYDDQFFQILAKTCLFLSNGKVEEARIHFQSLKNVNWKKYVIVPFLEYFPLHFELSLKNKGMSRLLYQEIIQKGKLHYFDDFYLARLQLIEGKKEEAYDSFGRLMENIKKYGSENRFIFELQFAKEIKSSDMFLLMSRMNTLQSSKLNLNDKKTFVNATRLNTGINLLIGDSLAIQQVKSLIRKFAKLNEPVLITGETGTGKELVARSLHAEGANPQQPFLAINCGALTESLLQSELFGYVAGAFTGAQKERKGIFEAAGKGTVFLDEFGEITPKMQTALLRVLESNEIRLIGGTSTRKIECRIVIATNVDLKQAVKDKKFREDLFFRLTRFDIKLPALRERKEDISMLSKFFLMRAKESNGIQQALSEELLAILISYQWPGNIRELKNEMERLKILHAEKEVLNKEDFDFTRLQGHVSMSLNLPKEETINENLKIEKKKRKIQELILDKEHIANIIENSSKAKVRIQCFKELFIKYKKLTRSQIVKITYISPSTVTKDLKTLCDSGFIEKRMPTKSVNSHYFILVE